MSTGVSLVEYVADLLVRDTSIARRFIVEGCIKVDGEVISDPAFRLPQSQAHRIKIDTVDFAKRLLDATPAEKESA